MESNPATSQTSSRLAGAWKAGPVFLSRRLREKQYSRTRAATLPLFFFAFSSISGARCMRDECVLARAAVASEEQLVSVTSRSCRFFFFFFILLGIVFLVRTLSAHSAVHPSTPPCHKMLIPSPRSYGLRKCGRALLTLVSPFFLLSPQGKGGL